MKRTQLAAAILMAGGFCTNVLAATYTVTPAPLRDTAQNSFAHSIDNSGKMLATVTLELNPSVDVEQLIAGDAFFDNSNYPLENEDDVREGIFSDADYSTIYNYLIAIRGSSTGQQLANARSYITDTVDAQLVPGLDVVTDKFDDYTQSVVTIARDSLNGDFIVGSSEGVTIEQPYENEEEETIVYTYKAVGDQAFVEVNGETKRLAPKAKVLGGISQAYAVNDNFQVAGYGTVSFGEKVNERIEKCEDPDTRGDVPVELCKANIRNLRDYLDGARTNATIWQLDANGEVISLDTYPLLFTPEEDDTNAYYTHAYGINNQGIAVGRSFTGEGAEYAATVFRDGETVEILPSDENLRSIAYDINDNNWVTGHVLRSINSTQRKKLFVYNLDTGESKYPDSFFDSSSVEVNAINNNDIVVGKADFDDSLTTDIPETHAFMYDIGTDTFTDLNDLTACDSPYTLVEAVDINDNNEIIANARIRTARRYISGADIINEEGETIEDDFIIAVKLSPQPNGEIEQCGDDDQGQDYERHGAALSPWWLLLLTVIGFRRRK